MLFPELQNVKKLLETPVDESSNQITMNLEDDPAYVFSRPFTSSYNLILKTNTLLSQIGEEIAAIHHAVSSLYATKFPELVELISNPLDYLRVVALIQNETVQLFPPSHF